jgi:hypothetical protein
MLARFQDADIWKKLFHTRSEAGCSGTRVHSLMSDVPCGRATRTADFKWQHIAGDNQPTPCSSPWEACSCFDNQEGPRLLWNRTIHARVHKSPPLISVLSQINPVHDLTLHLFQVQFEYAYCLRLGLPSRLFPYFLAARSSNVFCFSSFLSVLQVPPVSLYTTAMNLQIRQFCHVCVCDKL